MNDEIKEILKKLEEFDDLSSLDYKQLLDYITNLQQENERLKLEIERLNDVLVHKPDEKIMLKTNDGKELFIIQSERIDMQEELNKTNMQLMIQLEDYKARIEKADWYLLESLECLYHGANFTFDELIHNTSDILNGRSDE